MSNCYSLNTLNTSFELIGHAKKYFSSHPAFDRNSLFSDDISQGQV
jgi:hypothetical protein